MHKEVHRSVGTAFAIEKRGVVKVNKESAEGMGSQESIFDPIPEMGGVPPSHQDSGHRIRNVHHTDKGSHKPQSRRLMSQRFAEGLPVSFSPGEGATAAMTQQAVHGHPDSGTAWEKNNHSWDHEEEHGSKLETNEPTDG